MPVGGPPDSEKAHLVHLDGDDLDDAQRAALHAELEASIAEAEAGETEDLIRLLADLRQQV
jgi:hypothetical protein